MKGLITKKQPTVFIVRANDQEYFCTARGNLKKEGLFVGDYVDFDENEKVINQILPRKNCIIRPPLANLDKIFIVIAEKPKADFELVDKLIIFVKRFVCLSNDKCVFFVRSKIMYVFVRHRNHAFGFFNLSVRSFDKAELVDLCIG